MFEKLRRLLGGGAPVDAGTPGSRTPVGRPPTNIVIGTITGQVVQVANVGNLVIGALDDRSEIRVLLDVTEANLRSLADRDGPPGGTARPEALALPAVEGSFVITGEPGCGKSGVLFRLAEHLRSLDEDVVLLSVDALGEGTGSVSSDVTLGRPLSAVLTGWKGGARGTLLIDGSDGAPPTWLARAVEDLHGSRWRTIATMRRSALLHSPAWRTAFAGPPVSQLAEHRDDGLTDVRHFLLGDPPPAGGASTTTATGP